MKPAFDSKLIASHGVTCEAFSGITLKSLKNAEEQRKMLNCLPQANDNSGPVLIYMSGFIWLSITLA